MAIGIRVHELVETPGAVALVCEGSERGSVRVDIATLAELLPTLDPTVEILVFLTESGSDTAAPPARDVIDQIAVLVRSLTAAAAAAAIRRVPAVNAAKRVRDGVVVAAVDRETLNILQPPEVVDRRALEAALEELEQLGRLSEPSAVSPAVIVGSSGGEILVVETSG